MPLLYELFPLPIDIREDSRYWVWDSKGEFSVCEGYKFAIGFYKPPNFCSEVFLKQWWHLFWALNVPPKVKVFWWRMSNDIIPTGMNLKAHYVPHSGGCMFCGCSLDTTCHSLFFCSPIKHLLRGTQFYSSLKEARNGSTIDLCLWMKLHLSKEEFETFVVRTWAIWNGKQHVCHRDKSKKDWGLYQWCSKYACKDVKPQIFQGFNDTAVAWQCPHQERENIRMG